jgi:FeS assembly SUF system protein
MSASDVTKAEDLRGRVIEVLRTCYDPEIPANIYDLGLIYDLDVDAAGKVAVRMTLTSPSCPVAELLPAEVGSRIEALDGVTDVCIHIVWDPPWSRDSMSEAAKLQLGIP